MNQRSHRYQAAVKDLDLSKTYPVEEALELAKKTSNLKFDASVEVHFRLGIDPKQTEQNVRFAVKLPHGSGKKKRIAAFVTSASEKAAKAAGADIVGGDELINEIKKTEKLDFDIAVAEPAMMKNLAQIAKILGTKGKMPSPKTGTVTADIARAIAEIGGGRVDVKSDDSGNVHQIIGKVSFTPDALKENFEALLAALKAAKPKGAKQEFIKSLTISTSMGPGIKTVF
ncbi:MAG: 50S ribosomal protein L1 [Patescibacteria group bacterium]|nr:50S ribosomal protein L1 [Patescibacteria group bacterium]